MNASSSFPENEVKRVLAALSTVFNVNPLQKNASSDTDISTREAADRYLTQFQRSDLAWVISEHLLSTSQETHVYFFAAQTIHVKCQSDVLQLNQEQMSSLRESLMNFLLQFIAMKGAKGSKAVVTRLGMACCTLAVQMGWMTIIDDLLTNLQNCAEPTQLECLIELTLTILKLLPEEATSDRVLLQNESERYAYIDGLIRSSKKVLDFLFYCASNTNGHSDETKSREQVLRCLHSWIRYVNIHPECLENNQLVNFAFAILQANDINQYEGELFDICVDVVIELLRCYPSDRGLNLGLVHKLIPLVMALGMGDHCPFKKAVLEEDEDAMRDYCRIFTEMGESYMSLIMHHEDLDQVKLVELVLACSALPDNEIASITLHFWYRFVAWLEDIQPYDYRQLQIDNFTPQLIQLVSTCTTLLKYPTDIETLTDDRIDDIHRGRMYVNDTLEDCCRLLGGDLILKNICFHLKVEVTRVSDLGEHGLQQWHTIESCLKALQATSRYVPQDEHLDMPFVMGLIPSLPTTVVYLRTTANLVVGAFAQWLNRHPESLAPIFPFLRDGLSDPKCASSAAITIKNLCENCSSHFSLGDSVLQLYDSIVLSQLQQNTSILDIKDELEVLEGACRAVSRKFQEMGSQQDAHSKPEDYVKRIVEPIGSRLVQFSSLTSQSPKQVVAEVERLTVVVRYLIVPTGRSGFLVGLMTQCWPYLECISLKYTDFHMAEKLCRLHKHCLRTCGSVAYKPLLEKLCNYIVEAFRSSHQSPYLYAASVIIQEYGRDVNSTTGDLVGKCLHRMLDEMSKISFQLLNCEDRFKNHPDIVEELFFLASRVIQFCPDIFVPNDIFQYYMKCATLGMVQHHRDANRGTLSFLDQTFAYGITLQSMNQNVASRTALEQAITHEGPTIVSNLILSMTGELPSYRISSNTSVSVAGTFHKLFSLCPALVKEWSDPPLSKVSAGEKDLLLGVYADVSKDEFLSICERFGEICSRSSKMGFRN